LLSREAYNVETRSLEHRQHRDEMAALGYTMVPVVVIDGRHFPGFPDEVLRRGLGLPSIAINVEDFRMKMKSGLGVLHMVERLVKHIPQELWEERLAPDRDRPLGQWVWHIFHLPEVFLGAVRDGVLGLDALKSATVRQHWYQEPEFPSFEAVASYAWAVIQRLDRWISSVDAHDLSQDIDTPWGLVTVAGALDHVERHSAIHLRQLVSYMKSRDDKFTHLPTDESLKQVPDYAILYKD